MTATATGPRPATIAPDSDADLPILARHLRELRASGLTDETIRAAGLRWIKGEAVRDVLGWSPKSGIWGDCLLYPFHDGGGNETGFARVKPDFPRTDDKGRVVKYESPRKTGNRAYFPPGFAEAFKTASTVIITEGEKKTLAAMQAGLCCIGLVGVWGWQVARPRNEGGKSYGERRLLPDLVGLKWKGKTAVILFDSDAADNANIQLGEFRLAELLTEFGADVRVARMPAVAQDGKTGVDDFLVHHGDSGPASLVGQVIGLPFVGRVGRCPVDDLRLIPSPTG